MAGQSAKPLSVWGFKFFQWRKQLSNLNLQRKSYLYQALYRNILLTPFNATSITPTNLGSGSKIFL